MIDIKITNIEEFLQQLPRLSEKLNGNLFYRGQSDSDYILTPFVLRNATIEEKENEIYSQIMIECAHEFDASMSHNEILSKMQHYGAPTRLLDTTTNPLVALYFACEKEVGKQKTDGAVYILEAEKHQIKQFDSDIVTILSCLPRFTLEEKAEIHRLALRFESQIKEFNSHPLIKRLLHEIRKEKVAFEPAINPNDMLNFYHFTPRKTNSRIIRQSGSFIIFGLEPKEVNYYNRIIVDANAKSTIIKQLSVFGISKGTLYPELYKVAEALNDKYKRTISRR